MTTPTPTPAVKAGLSNLETFVIVSTFSALVILLIDYKIKQDVVRAAKEVRQAIEAFERKYYNGQFAGPADTRNPGDGPTRPDSDVVRVAGVAAGVDSSEDPGGHRAKARERNRTNARTRGGSVAVPKESGPME